MQRTIEFAVKGLLFCNGHFLAMHKAGITSNKYELPGGRMVFGETAEQTLIREMKEETGLVVAPLKLVDTWHYLYNDQRQISGIIYLCAAKDCTGIVLSPEHTDYQWLLPSPESFERMNSLFRAKMEAWDWEALMQSALQSAASIK